VTSLRQVVVLVLDGALPMDVGIPAQIFRERPGLPYRMIMTGPQPGEVEAAGGFRFAVDHGLETLEVCDTIVVPGYADTRRAISPEVTGALRAAYDRGARIASVCTGAFALAAAALLDAPRATTHWASADELARRYPSIRVDRDVLFVDEGQVLTSAGVAAGIDLCLHLIRRDFGVRVSNDIARHIVAAPYRGGGQAQYIPRTLPEDVDDAFARTREWALTRLHEDLTVRDLAQHAHVSYRTFSRRFVEDTGHTPLQWLLRARIDVARELLEATDLGIDHIAARAGLGTSTNLRLHFQRLLGTTPSQYRKSFSNGSHTFEPSRLPTSESTTTSQPGAMSTKRL
jgi:transcriptional regulator GlxA family with amidase domain